MSVQDEQIVISRDGDSLPVIEVLTGRGFVTGKSGSGKSFSTNVILEGLLEQGHPFLIIDTDGEYWGLKEKYSVLHLGTTDKCDVEVDESDADTIVDVALDGQPVILDVSGFLHAEESQQLIKAVITRLFREEKQRRQPFVLVVEEIHEYIPEQSGLSDVGEVLIQIAKRGRKHGLGILGISQRPAAVDKDFITQCDWIVWHKLTWKNDTNVVDSILGSEPADVVQTFDPGEAYLMADWEEELRRIKFKLKETYDAGATPGMEADEPPPLKAVDSDIISRFDSSLSDASKSDAKNDHTTNDSSADERSNSEDTNSVRSSNEVNTGSQREGPSSSATQPISEHHADHVAIELVVEFAYMIVHLVSRIIDKTVSTVKYGLTTSHATFQNWRSTRSNAPILSEENTQAERPRYLVLVFGILLILTLVFVIIVIV